MAVSEFRCTNLCILVMFVCSVQNNVRNHFCLIMISQFEEIDIIISNRCQRDPVSLQSEIQPYSPKKASLLLAKSCVAEAANRIQLIVNRVACHYSATYTMSYRNRTEFRLIAIKMRENMKQMFVAK